MLSPGEYNQTQRTRELSELADHPGWPHLLKLLDQHEEQLREELLVIDDVKELVRAHDIWRIFTRVIKLVKETPGIAKDNYQSIMDESQQTDVDLSIGNFFHSLPTLSNNLINPQMLE